MGFLNKITNKIKKGNKEKDKEIKEKKESKKEKEVSDKSSSVAKTGAKTIKEEKEAKNEIKRKEDKDEKKTEKKSFNKTYSAYSVLKRPLVTEKSNDLSSLNKYIFEVYLGANKLAIKTAIKEVYGITPVAVNILRRKGKTVNYGRIKGKRNDTKKAIVTLKKGDKIEVYEGV